MTGGRHRKGHKTRKVRRGGAGYGFGPAVTVGTLEVVPNSTSTPYSSATGAAIPDPYATNGSSSTLMGGRRRKSRSRKTKKSKKAGKRRSRGRKMRGGMYPGSVNSAPAGASFVGAVSGMPGSQTYGAYASYPQNVPAGNPHTVGPDGVTRV
jgi:hypothetical protein